MDVRSGRHPILEGMREHARERFAKAAVRWRCNDYPYATLLGMIDARARVLQLKGIRAGQTVALPAARGIDAVVNVAALWAIGGIPMVLPASHQPAIAGEAAVRERVVGVLSHDGEYAPTGLVSNGSPPQTGSATIIFSPVSGPAGTDLKTRTARQLVELSHKAQASFGVADRTVLGLAPANDGASAFEVWAVLARGGTVDLVDDEAANDPAKLLEHLIESTADLVQLNAPAISMLAPSRSPHLVAAQVRDVILPEVSRADHAAVIRIFPRARLQHASGTTDCEDSFPMMTCA